MKNRILGCDDIFMEKAKGMNLFIILKLLKDDLNEKGMRYIYMLTLDVVKSCHMVVGNGLMYLEV